MFRRLLAGVMTGVAVLSLQAAPAAAQQAFTVQVGSFMPRTGEARVRNDVLLTNQQYLVFDITDFNAVTAGGEWTAGFGDFFEAGVGVGFYQRTVPTFYDQWVNTDGTDIQQALKLRLVPVSAVLRILPLGANRGFQPYVGGGMAVCFWRYSESGNFVDLTDKSIFRDSFVAKGTAVGPIALVGVRGRLTRHFNLGVEMRMQWAQATLSTQDFLSDKLDLGGLSVLSTFSYRF